MAVTGLQNNKKKKSAFLGIDSLNSLLARTVLNQSVDQLNECINSMNFLLLASELERRN
jgi:hypothetical protein